LVLEAVACLRERFGDFFRDFLRGDGAVGAVDLGQALAFGVASRLLCFCQWLRA